MRNCAKQVIAAAVSFAFLGNGISVATAQDLAAPLLIVPGISQKDAPHGSSHIQHHVSPAPVLRIPAQPALAQQSVTQEKPKGLFGIDIGGLDSVDPEAVGTLNGFDASAPVSPWNRDLGSNLWFGADRNTAISLIKALPNAAVSPSAQDMVRQILLTAAAPKAQTSADPKAKGQLVAARMEKLVQTGRATDALALANILAREVVTEPVILARTQAQWLAGDIQNACASADTSARQFDNPIWPKMQAACAAIDGDVDKAQLKLALLNELNLIDDAFQPIANKILGRKTLSLAEIPAEMQPFEAAAFKALGGSFPENLPLHEKPWLVNLAIPAKGSITDGHLALVEFALARRLMTAAEADAIYQRVRFTDKEEKSALNLEVEANTVRTRVLYRVMMKRIAEAQPEIPAAKIEVLSRLLKGARNSSQAQIALSSLLAEDLSSLSEEPLAAWLAGDAARLSLWAGNWSEAGKWVALAQKNSGGSEAARRALQSILPLMKIAEAAVTPEMRAAGAPVQMVQSWTHEQAKRGLDDEQIRILRDRMFGLYRMLSLPIHEQDWNAAVAEPSKPTNIMSVSPVLSMSMSDAANRGARGLVLGSVAKQLETLTASNPDQAAPQDINAMVQALLQSAAVDWAKRIAVENLLFNGA